MSTQSTPKPCILLDATALRKASCMLRLRRTVVDGYWPKSSNLAMRYGIAFHRFMELIEREDDLVKAMTTVRQEKAEELALELAKAEKSKDWMTMPHLIGIISRYYEHWKKDSTRTVLSPKDNSPLVELKFAIPLVTSHPVYDVALSGTIDRIARVGQNGAYMILDYKTTAKYDRPKYLDSYALSHQLRIYALAIRWFAKQFPGSIFAEIYGTNQCVGACIEGIFLNKEMSKCGIERSRVFFFNEQELAAFEKELEDIAYRLLAHDGQARDGIACNACSPMNAGMFQCEFFDVCNAPNQGVKEHLLNTQFLRKPYNPLEFH